MITASKHALQGICTVDIDMAWGVLGLGLGLELEGWPYGPDSQHSQTAQHSTAQLSRALSTRTVLGVSVSGQQVFCLSFFCGSEAECHRA